MRLTIKKAILFGLLFFMSSVLSSCGTTKVALDKYIQITSEGYDSIGRVSYEFDYKSFQKDYSGKIKLRSKNSDELVATGLNEGKTIEQLLVDTCTGGELDKTSGLSNGDVVNFVWDCNDTMAKEYFDVELEYSDISYKVENLKGVKEFNPFEYLSISLEGIEPHGSISLKKNNEKTEMQDITFSLNKNDNLVNGDTIKITANVQGSMESFIDKYGAIVSPLELDYEVVGLKSYASSASQIPDDMLEKMIEQGKDVFMSYTATSWRDGYEIKTVDYVGNYFTSLKEGISGPYNNQIYIILYIDFIEIDGNEYDFYYQVNFKDILIDGEGNCFVDLSDYKRTNDVYKYNNGKYSLHGYGTIDSLFETVIQPQIDRYKYEKNLIDS